MVKSESLGGASKRHRLSGWRANRVAKFSVRRTCNLILGGIL
jgi:hypothetical protein